MYCVRWREAVSKTIWLQSIKPVRVVASINCSAAFMVWSTRCCDQVNTADSLCAPIVKHVLLGCRSPSWIECNVVILWLGCTSEMACYCCLEAVNTWCWAMNPSWVQGSESVAHLCHFIGNLKWKTHCDAGVASGLCSENAGIWILCKCECCNDT